MTIERTASAVAEAILTEARERAAQVLANEAAHQAEQAALAESETARQQREQRQAEQAAALAQWELYATEARAALVDTQAPIRARRDAFQAALELLRTAEEFQAAAQAGIVSVITQIAAGAGSFRVAFDSDNEFQAALDAVILETTNDFVWHIDAAAYERTALRIYNRRWAGPTMPDARQTAIRRGLKHPVDVLTPLDGPAQPDAAMTTTQTLPTAPTVTDPPLAARKAARNAREQARRAAHRADAPK